MPVPNVLLTPEIQQAYNRKLLTRFRTTTVFNRFGDTNGIPRNGGVNLQWRKMEIIRPVPTGNTSSWQADSVYTAAAAALLAEGSLNISATIATWTSVSATVQQYGQYAIISDWLDAQSIDPQVPNYVENFGEAMSELLDLVTRDVLVASTTLQYANGRANPSLLVSGDFLTLLELRKAVKTLKRNNAKPAEDGKFVAIVHPDTMYDLQGDSNITTVWNYGGAPNNDLFNASFKDIPFGIRLYESTLAPVTRYSGLPLPWYNTIVLAKEAYGTVKIDALPSKVIVHNPGTSGVSDPLDQQGTVGWKANFAAVILNQSNMVRILHATSSNVATIIAVT